MVYTQVNFQKKEIKKADSTAARTSPVREDVPPARDTHRKWSLTGPACSGVSPIGNF